MRSRPRLLGVLVLLNAACAAPRTAHPVEPTASLRVATFNVNYGLAGDPETRAAIDATEADVVVLQEASDAWIASIDEMRWRHRCVARSPYPAGGAVILSRLPLARCARSASAVGWFPAVAATLRSPTGRLRVIGLHLQPARAGVSVVSDLRALPDLHRREVRAHLDRLTDPDADATLVAGDFNEGDGEGGLQELAARGYRSALAQHQPSATTWRWPIGAMQVEKRLDHLLYDPRALRCVDATVLTAGRSDHRPVVATFSTPWRPPPLGASLMRGDVRASAYAPR